MADQLQAVLTPALFDSLVDAHFLFSTTEPLDFEEVGRKTFHESWLGAEFSVHVWSVLVAVSKVGLDSGIDLIQFLPAPEDPRFPRQALGCQLLLDQAPWALCRKIDRRWVPAYFDILSLRLAWQLNALPVDQQPYSWARWRDSTSL